MKYTVITGASSGIGYATALNFARQGKNLILIARSEDKLDFLKNEIQQINKNVDIKNFTFDLSDSRLLHEKVIPILERFEIDTLINNAGFGIAGNILNSELDAIEKMIELDVKTLVSLSIWFVEKYKNKENKKLLNISSTAGYNINTRAVLYAASKNFVATFTEGLSKELKKGNFPLQAKILAPYATETNFAKTSLGINDFSYKDNYQRYHTPEQMAEFIYTLLQSNQTVGKINATTMELELSGPLLDWSE